MGRDDPEGSQHFIFVLGIYSIARRHTRAGTPPVSPDGADIRQFNKVVDTSQVFGTALSSKLAVLSFEYNIVEISVYVSQS